MPSARSCSTASTIWPTVRPNLARSPLDSSQRPAPRLESLARMPMFGLTPMRRATSTMREISLPFSTTMVTSRPSWPAIRAVSMYSTSL